MKILIVDDSGTMRAILKRSLLELGVKMDDITTAANGEAGLEAFKEGTFDVVMTDWHMPRMDGLELLKAIRAIDQDVPVIMVTTQGEEKHVQEANDAKATGFIVKPFSVETLASKLEKWVGTPA